MIHFDRKNRKRRWVLSNFTKHFEVLSKIIPKDEKKAKYFSITNFFNKESAVGSSNAPSKILIDSFSGCSSGDSLSNIEAVEMPRDNQNNSEFEDNEKDNTSCFGGNRRGCGAGVDCNLITLYPKTSKYHKSPEIGV